MPDVTDIRRKGRLPANGTIVAVRDGRQQHVGIDEGIIVKCGDEVRVATGRAIRGTNLATLKREVERWFLEMDERAAIARTAMARLEAGVVRRFTELRQRTRL